jgi:hypothetical protein
MDKRILIIVIIVTIVGLVFSPAIMDIMMPSLTLNTDSVEQSKYNFKGRIEFQTGASTPSEVDQEGLQSIKYATSWLPTGNSQTIVVQWFVQSPYWNVNILREGRIDIYLKHNDNEGWEKAENLVSTVSPIGVWNYNDGWVLVKTHTFQINGEYVGGVKAQGVGKIYHDLIYEDWGHNLGKDEAYLYSGDGEIGVKGDSNLFERGETITFEVDTGLSGQGAGEGWEIWIHEPNGNQYDTITNIADVTNNQLISWTVPDDAPFYTSIQNQWTAKLNNGLFGIADTTFFTVDDKDLVPSQPVITVSDAYVDVDETITVTATSTPNNETNCAIQWFDVWVWYGGKNSRPTEDSDANWIITETEYGSVDNSVTFQFTPRKEGIITIEINAHDTGNRDSGSSFKQVEATKSPFVDVYSGDSSILTIFLIIILFLGAVFMFLPVPIQLKLIISGVLIMVAIYCFVTGV